MACEPWRAQLDPYLDGELSAADAAALNAHLRTCGLRRRRSATSSTQTMGSRGRPALPSKFGVAGQNCPPRPHPAAAPDRVVLEACRRARAGLC
jgi:anti-sigma factor RsiW